MGLLALLAGFVLGMCASDEFEECTMNSSSLLLGGSLCL